MTTPQSVTRYDLLDLAQLRATFLSTDALTPADPSTMMFLVKNPNGSVATYAFGAAGASVVRTATGAYFKDLTVDVVGSWFYRSYGTGGVQASEEWSFLCAPSFVL